MSPNSPDTIGQLKQAVSTAVAAKALNRKPQTLRMWACLGTGPIQPVRINGRLAWPLAQIAALLEGGGK
jgi:hypothetical protein